MHTERWHKEERHGAGAILKAALSSFQSCNAEDVALDARPCSAMNEIEHG